MKVVALFLLILFVPLLSSALDYSDLFGVRVGVSAESGGEDISVVEVYYLPALPWQKSVGSWCTVTTRLDVGLGLLEVKSGNGAWLAGGGDVVLGLLAGRLSLEAGFRPALLSTDHFARHDLGGPFQFVSHVGMSVMLSRFALDYRYQHISNANVYSENDGLDLHLVGLGFQY